MTPDSFAALLDRASQILALQIKLAEMQALHEAQRAAVRHSSGRLTQAQLNAMGNPLAKRHGTALIDPGEINIQSRTRAGTASPEAFVEHWETEGPTEQGGELVGVLFNSDPKAPLLEAGTRLMFARPVTDKVIADVTQRRLDLLDEAFELAFR